MSVDSTRPSSSRKADARPPAKPYSKFPLGVHASGKFCKRIGGKLFYFGQWARRVDGKLKRLPWRAAWQEALQEYESQAADLHAGRTPRARRDEPTMADLGNSFLSSKLRKLEAGELSQRSFDEYREFTDRVIESFGKHRLIDDLRPEDFGLLRAAAAKPRGPWGPLRLSKFIQCTRTLFKYGFTSGLLEKPVRYGDEFDKPSADVLRKHRAKQPKKLFEPEEIRRLIDAASPQMRCMILLGIGCAYGNSDIALLPLEALDLENCWATFPRVKTGIERKAKLWPETTQALKVVLKQRPKPRREEDANLVFLTRRGNRWVEGEKNAVGLQFRKLLRKCRLNHKKGRAFYALRHTFRTVADELRDLSAARRAMGHTDGSIDSLYIERVDDSRLERIAQYVHDWLFPEGGGK